MVSVRTATEHTPACTSTSTHTDSGVGDGASRNIPRAQGAKSAEFHGIAETWGGDQKRKGKVWPVPLRRPLRIV